MAGTVKREKHWLLYACALCGEPWPLGPSYGVGSGSYRAVLPCPCETRSKHVEEKKRLTDEERAEFFSSGKLSPENQIWIERAIREAEHEREVRRAIREAEHEREVRRAVDLYEMK